MSKTKKKSMEDLYLSLRKDWNGFNPQTQIIKPKNNYSRKQKYKPDYLKSYEDEI